MYILESYVGQGVLPHLAFDIRYETAEKRKKQRLAIGIAVSSRG